ncbi:phage replisome organizer N-terminal domain-containing protein [Clostridium sp. HBUAS56017]|uniref:phage replisome organizer N-terminal domain-containing protein n=1 Tax=Clostridium sp. HBUAS56017 TaxID=2571128 RepID=UPI001178499C|nr:phage replisome organizer N-terminal domain-containing protein [Clostridium sp. HBUAS56017]
MRERKYVKFRVDMYDDTKFKIIDMKPERDLIHYVWTRIVTLAGKVNLEGNLYLSKNIPYTVETLAIEFNRDVDQIKLALDVLIDLEMIEFDEGKIYRVKNFVKHQNIKVKEKNKLNDNKEKIEEQEINMKDDIHNKDEEYKNKIEDTNDEFNKEINVINNGSEDIVCNDQGHIPLFLDTKNNKKTHKRKKKSKNSDITGEEIEDSELVCFHDGYEESPLGKNESIAHRWAFC